MTTTMEDYKITDRLIKDKRIAIVGGGPGGLTLARMLQQKGADVKVYERDEHKNVRVQGATLDLHEESGLAALAEGGLMEAFKANYRPGADKLRIVDKHGVIMHDENDEEESNRPEIDRGPLRKILLDSLEDGTVVWDSHFSCMVQAGGQWKIEFKNGTFALADIVIAADGANSKIRPFITPIRPFYSGVTMVEGAVYNSAVNSPKIHELLNGGKIFALNDEKSLIVSSKGDGSLVFYTGMKSGENWVKESGIDFNDKEEVKAWFTTEFSGWDAIWLELFENCEAKFIPRPQYCMPLDQKWETLPNLTMLGDAAHLMPPFAGEGVNMAMLDALELSRCLTNDDYPNLHSALAHYEKEMLRRSSEVAEETLQQTEAFHAQDALNYLVGFFTALR
jgi:2-polyprenyl-6-methoxyphenol hydroxylase-like FAD-dependent oxidoreductase